MKKIIGLLACSMIGLTGCSQTIEPEPPLIDRAVFFQTPEISYGQISPDGKYFSFLKPVNGINNIWVKELYADFETAYRITDETVRPIRSYTWSRDGNFVLYTQDQGGNENYRLYAKDPSQKPAENGAVLAAKDLTPIEDVRVMIYDFPQNKPNQAIIGINDRNPELHDVYALDLTTGDRELIWENNQRYAGFYFNQNGELKLLEQVTPEGEIVLFRPEISSSTSSEQGAEKSAGVEIWRTAVAEKFGFSHFNDDGKTAYIVTNQGSDFMELRLIDIETGETTFVESDPEKTVDFGGAVVSEKENQILATYYIDDRIRMYPKTDAMAAMWKKIRGKIGDKEIHFRNSDTEETLWVIAATADTDPGSVYVYDSEKDELTLQYISRTDIPREHLAPMKPIRYTSRDGREIKGYLTLPRGKSAENLPIVVHPHGGPQARDTWGYASYVQFLANRGYAVLQVNFRGSTGYGKDFQNSGDREFGTGLMQHDITDGVQYLIDEGIADPEKVAIFGASYGGYATLAGLAFTPDIYAAGISYVGVSNLVTLIKSVPPYWKPILAGWYRRVGNPENAEDRADMEARSPLFSAENITGALLVAQGANDPRVTQAESDQIVQKLHGLGRPVEYLLAKNEGHGFAQENNRMALAAAIEKFLASHIGGRFQADMPTEITETLEKLTVDPAAVSVEAGE